jgi:hypothetical protein
METIVLFWKHKAGCYIDDYDFIELSQTENGNTLKLSSNVKRSIYLGPTKFGNAERLSQYLEMPFHFTVGIERVIQLPKFSKEYNPELLALNCTQCGGQLPKIEFGDHHVTCEFCNTTSRIDWKNG